MHRSKIWLRNAIAVAAFLWIAVSGLAASAIEFRPPDTGKPGRLKGAGTRMLQVLEDLKLRGHRGGIPSDGIVEAEGSVSQCLALVPENAVGLTVSAYPSLFFYVTGDDIERVSFSLTKGAGIVQNEYEQSWVPTVEKGLIRVDLSEASRFVGLEEEEVYYWRFSARFSNGEQVVRGAIAYVSPPEDFEREVAASSPFERAKLYAETGLWFDAASVLDDLRRADREETVELANREWKELLDSVDLEVR